MLVPQGGGHIATLLRDAHRQKHKLPKFILSDAFPATSSWESHQKEFGETDIGYLESKLDILNAPPTLPKYWSMFAVFHHFEPEKARLLLKEVTEKADGLLIAEMTSRSWYCFFMCVCAFFPNLFSSFFSKEFKLQKLFLTMFFPISTVLILFDGIVSGLRTYTRDEIIDMLPPDKREKFDVELVDFWFGYAPMKASIIFITRKNASVPDKK